MRIKRILTTTLSAILLTGTIFTTTVKAAPGSKFASNSKEYQEFKQLAQSFQRGGSCYIDDSEAESALGYVEGALYDDFSSQEVFNQAMKKDYSYLLYDCQTMAGKSTEKPKETQPSKPKETPKKTEKPKPKEAPTKKQNTTKPSQAKRNEPTRTTAPKKSTSTTTKPKATISTAPSAVDNKDNTVKETPKETVKESKATETEAETKDKQKHGKEVKLDELRGKKVAKIQRHGNHWHVFTKDGEEFITHENPSTLLDTRKETKDETTPISDNKDVEKDRSNNKKPIIISGIILTTIASVAAVVVYKKRNKSRGKYE